MKNTLMVLSIFLLSELGLSSSFLMSSDNIKKIVATNDGGRVLVHLKSSISSLSSWGCNSTLVFIQEEGTGTSFWGYRGQREISQALYSATLTDSHMEFVMNTGVKISGVCLVTQMAVFPNGDTSN